MTELTATCRTCGEVFSYPPKGGRHRRYCSEECYLAAKAESDKKRRARGDFRSRLLGADEETVKAHCDLVITRAAALMTGDFKAPVEMVIDRLVTYACAQTAASFGREQAIRMLNHAAIQIENGVFDHIEGASPSPSKPH